MRFEVIQGDITKLQVDAIVNAANSSLLGGGGVDGAIHRAAGPLLLAECRTLNGCEVGEAKATLGYNLPAKHVIHTVGPVYRDGESGERDKLYACYENCLKLASQMGLKSIAFPSISTGVYGYPYKAAATVAHYAAREFWSKNAQTTLHTIVFCCFEWDDYYYQKDMNDFCGDELIDTF
jgi:O-acetyl-ADP-ribose deacetylase (regulator of RNase III)